jgi:hypothetical protein
LHENTIFAFYGLRGGTGFYFVRMRGRRFRAKTHGGNFPF